MLTGKSAGDRNFSITVIGRHALAKVNECNGANWHGIGIEEDAYSKGGNMAHFSAQAGRTLVEQNGRTVIEEDQLSL